MAVNWDNEQTEDLINTILALNGVAEAKKFFRDLLTENELIEFSNRWQAAQMLNNNVPYSVIEQQTGLSSRTIARISTWLNNGNGGYTLALNKIVNHHHNPPPVGKGL